MRIGHRWTAGAALAALLCAAPGPAAAFDGAAPIETPQVSASLSPNAASQPTAVPRKAASPTGALMAGEIDRLIDRVVALNEHYGLGWSHTGALIARLEESFAFLDRGRYDEAAEDLAGFKQRIREELRAGSLPEEPARKVLDQAGGLEERLHALARVRRLEHDLDETAPADPSPP